MELSAYLDNRFDLVLSHMDLQTIMLGGIQSDLQILVRSAGRHIDEMGILRREFRVMLSAGDDVRQEGQIAHQVLNQLKLDPFLNEFLEITVEEDHASIDQSIPATANGNSSLAASRPAPSDCDLVVIILWAEFDVDAPETVRAEWCRHVENRVDIRRCTSGR